jgi:2-alkyl-3-oxoalkanoate reductase
MKVLVTGASGFLGRAVVRAASAAGHDVIAMVRPTAKTDGLGWNDNVTTVRGDLRQRGAWTDAMSVDAVIHLAAAASGDLPTQFAGTVVATENLLGRLDWSAVRRFVHVSSFSVYDFSAIRSGAILDETVPLEPTPMRRDAYTTTKLIQERLVVTACEAHKTPLTIIRPGAIFGPGKTWNFGRVGSAKGMDFVFAPNARARLTHVENCADAIVRALDAPSAAGGVYNIVDDDLPTFGQFHRMCRANGAPVGRMVPVPWWLVASTGWMIDLMNRRLFKGRAKLPEILSYPRQHVQWKPIRYSNDRAKRDLGWHPHVPLATGIKAMIAAEQSKLAPHSPGESGN